MKVPLLDLRLQYQSIKDEIDEAILKVAASQALILGEEVERLERTLAEYCNTQFAIGASSGTDALLMALMALDIKPYDEVILPDYSFFATAGVVARLNAIPVFIDSDPVSFNIDPEAIRSAINAKTRAIIPVHLYGQAAYMKEILEIAEESSIPVIEDCAQAIGAQYPGHQKVGSMGLMGCFSFYPTKNLGAFGDGGFISTNNEEMAQKLYKMRNHGMAPKYSHGFIGGNFRLDAIQAAVLNVKFPHLEEWHSARRQNASLYTKYFIEKGLAEEEGIIQFDEANSVLLPKPVYKTHGNHNYHIYNQYVVRVNHRDELRQHLTDNTIGTEIYYPIPFHAQPCFEYLKCNPLKYPVSNELARTVLALPIFPELTEEQIIYTVDKIAEFVKK